MSEHTPDGEEIPDVDARIPDADARVAAAQEVQRHRYEEAVKQLPDAAVLVGMVDSSVHKMISLGARLCANEIAQHHREFVAEISRELRAGRKGKLSLRERRILDRYNLGVLALVHLVAALGEGP